MEISYTTSDRAYADYLRRLHPDRQVNLIAPVMPSLSGPQHGLRAIPVQSVNNYDPWARKPEDYDWFDKLFLAFTFVFFGPIFWVTAKIENGLNRLFRCSVRV